MEAHALYRHLGEMRQTPPPDDEMSHICDMHYTHRPGYHRTARLRRLYGVNCACRRISCLRHAIIADTENTELIKSHPNPSHKRQHQRD